MRHGWLCALRMKETKLRSIWIPGICLYFMILLEPLPCLFQLIHHTPQRYDPQEARRVLRQGTGPCGIV